MKKALLTVLTFSLLSGWNIEAKRKYEGTLSFSVTDRREVMTRNIGENLLLRVKRVRSVTQELFGWDVEVMRKPFNTYSSNLSIIVQGGTALIHHKFMLGMLAQGCFEVNASLKCAENLTL